MMKELEAYYESLVTYLESVQPTQEMVRGLRHAAKEADQMRIKMRGLPCLEKGLEARLSRLKRGNSVAWEKLLAAVAYTHFKPKLLKLREEIHPSSRPKLVR